METVFLVLVFTTSERHVTCYESRGGVIEAATVSYKLI